MEKAIDLFRTQFKGFKSDSCVSPPTILGNTVPSNGGRVVEYDPASLSREKRPISSAVSMYTVEVISHNKVVNSSINDIFSSASAVLSHHAASLSTEKNYDSLITLTEKVKGDLN